MIESSGSEGGVGIIFRFLVGLAGRRCGRFLRYGRLEA